MAKTPHKTPEPIAGFASMPHALCADAGLKDGAYRVLGALIRFARDQPGCFPSNATIGKAAGGKKVGAVALALRELEKRGLIRRIIDPATQHRTGIELAWDRLATPSRNGGGPHQNSDSPHQIPDSLPSKNGGGPPQNSEGLYEEEAGEEVVVAVAGVTRGGRESGNGGGGGPEYPRTTAEVAALAERLIPGIYLGQKIDGFAAGYPLEWVTDALYCAFSGAEEPRKAARYINSCLIAWKQAGGPPHVEVAEARATVLRLHDSPRRDDRGWMNKGDRRRQIESDELDQLGKQLREAR